MIDETRPGSKTVSVQMPDSQRAWLVRQAADRAIRTGERASVSEIVRTLVEQAQHADGGQAA